MWKEDKMAEKLSIHPEMFLKLTQQHGDNKLEVTPDNTCTSYLRSMLQDFRSWLFASQKEGWIRPNFHRNFHLLLLLRKHSYLHQNQNSNHSLSQLAETRNANRDSGSSHRFDCRLDRRELLEGCLMKSLL